MIDTSDVRRVIGAPLYDRDGAKVGTVDQVYLDDDSGQPEWLTVNTGLFGSRETFVPVRDAALTEDGVKAPYPKGQIKDAPHVDTVDSHLSADREAELYRYYGLAGSPSQPAAGAPSSGSPAAGAVGHDTSGPTTDDAMTRSEERLHAGTEQVQTGRARLRKWIETEEVQVTVPVSRERARLETEPITDTNRDRAFAGPELSEEEHEVILSEERPVVAKETVPVERVRLTKDVEHSEETVSDSLRKERIAAEGDGLDTDR
jgi:uncharacterized protein (TIGR02271 family)